MEPIKTIAPIAFWNTKSFWGGIVPTVLTTVDMIISQLSSEGSEPVANALASVLNTIGFEVTGEQIAGFMRTLYPLYLLIFAQQRGTFSGAIPRPYTVDQAKETAVVQAVENGKSAFEMGKAIGKSIARR